MSAEVILLHLLDPSLNVTLLYLTVPLQAVI
jgi:hypothetical protein